MTGFRLGVAAAPVWRDAADGCLEGLLPVPSPASLGFVYLTDHHADAAGDIVAYLRRHTGVPHWVGTVGLGICATGIEHFGTPALAALVTDLPEETFRVFSATGGGGGVEVPDAWRESLGSPFGVVHGDPNHRDLAGLIARTAESAAGCFFVGGLSSSRGRYPQIADTIDTGGVSGVLFSPEVGVRTRLTQGCSPIGPRREVTRCEDSYLLELDGRPALEVFYEDIGDVLARDPRRIAGYIFAGLPIPGSDTGDYLVRNLVGIDPSNGIVAIGEAVEPGSSVMFCRRDGTTANEDLVRMLDELTAGLDRPPRGGLYYSCVARGPNLFGPGSRELRLVAERLGDVPLVGFFGNGEISHNRVYGYTGVLTLFV